MKKNNEVYQILDTMKVHIYVTDLNTNEIIYMNQKMKETIRMDDVIGKKCFEILQNRQKGLCGNCPKEKLKTLEPGAVVEWVEYNDKVERIFQNYDCLIPWVDGRLVHMQQSVDITDTIELNRQAKTDELCGLLNRRAGKEKLAQAVAFAKKEQRDIQVVLLDVDHLKQTNDRYGHREGDFLLRELSNVLTKRLPACDFMFRLSGDEFIIVSTSMDEKQMAKYMIDHLEQAKTLRTIFEKDYDFSFCFGIYTVRWDETLEINDMIAKADDVMYQQKLRYRKTQLAELKENPFRHSSDESVGFEFDSTLLYDALLKSTDDFIYICNMKTGVFRYSPAQVKMFDLPSEVICDPLPVWKSIIHPKDWDRFYRSNMEIGENQMDYHSVEFRAKNRYGEYIWLKCRGQLMRDEYGEPSIFAGIMTQLDRQNKIDPLTHLLNRQEFDKAGRAKLKDHAIDTLGILILDIDDFKNINELYDRSFGDMVLKSTAQLVQSILPGNAGLYKLDNDQMGILIENAQEEDVRILFLNIQKLLLHQQLLERYRCPVEISAGCCFSPKHANDFHDLLIYADYALQSAKANGKNQLCVFHEEILLHKQRTIEILRSLRESISEDFKDFSIAYQPQIDIHTRKMIGVEALMRWQCESLGMVSPVEFIPVMEENGLIQTAGLWVLRKAVQTCKCWLKVCPDFTVSVNVSALQVLSGEFSDKVEQILREEDFPAKNLILELTESNMMSNLHVFEEEFEKIRKLGIRLAMDDFGTGYSSLENLKRKVSDVVKIDRAFVKDIQNSSFDVVFIDFVTAICHSVDIKVCLEGVETQKELSLVEALDLDYYQGYLFGKPMSAEAISSRLEKEKTMVQ